MGNRFNRPVDSDLQIVASTAFSATGTSTAVNIPSVGAGDEDIDLVLNITAAAGTHDASNYFNIVLEAGETSGGTYYTVDGFSINSDVVAIGVNVFAINMRQISEAVGSQDAAYYRLSVTKVGTTATSVTTSAHFSRGV